MKDKDKSKKQLIAELTALRQRTTQLETKYQQTQSMLQKLTCAADQVSDNIVITDNDGIIEYINPAFEELTGYSQAEILGQTPRVLNAGQYDQQYFENLWQTVLAGQKFQATLTNKKKDGQLYTEKQTITPLKDAEGNITHFVSTSQNITQQIGTREALRESELQYRNLFDTMVQGVIYENKKGRVLSANTAAERILGLTWPQIQGFEPLPPLWRTIHEDGSDFPVHTYPFMYSLTTGKPVRNMMMGVYHPTKQDYRWITFDSVPQFRPGESEPYQVYIIFSDITESKASKEALQKAHHELEKRVQIRTVELATTNAALQTEIQERRQIEEMLRQREERYKGVFETAVTSIIVVDKDGFIVDINPYHVKRIGLGQVSKEVYLGTNILEREVIIKAGIVEAYKGVLQGDILEKTNVYFPTTSGQVDGYFNIRGVPFLRDGQVNGAVFVIEEVTERVLAEKEIRTRIRQQATVAKLGQYALSESSLLTLFDQAVTLVAYTLELEYCQILQFLPQKDVLVLQAGIGWRKDLVGQVTMGTETRSQAGYTLSTPKPVVVDDLNTEKRFTIAPIFRDHGAVSGMSTVIQGRDRPYGVLGTHSKQQRVFTNNDTTFLQAVANVLAAAVERQEAEEALRVYHDHLEELVAERTAELEKTNEHFQQEITEHMRTETALKKAKETAQAAQHAAENANRAKSTFLSNMSHELRTPLNGILGYTQLLNRNDNLTQKQHKAINTIHRSGEHLLMMINDILDLSKIEAQRMELVPTTFHLSNFLKVVAEIIQVRTEQNEVVFSYKRLSSLPTMVHGDETRLRQILLNLLGNAVKFTEKGSITFTVEVIDQNPYIPAGDDKKSNSPTNLVSNCLHRFVVTDTGLGISPDKLEEIFLPFHQVGDKRTQITGTGLGLAISQKLVALMGGNLQIKSTLGKGSTFWFEIELPEVNRKAEALIPQKQSKRIIGYKAFKQTKQQPIKILIVDDQVDNRLVLKDMLEPLGFDVIEGVNGQDALTKAIKFHPGLILMDLIMPTMDGFEATKQLRQNPEAQDITVIAISASASDKTRKESFAANCDDYITKPFDLDELLDKLQRYLPLAWIYDKTHEPQSASTQAEQIIPPPEAELKPLLSFAMMGNIKGIRQWVKTSEGLDPKFTPFVNHLDQLARGYKIGEIKKFIRRYVKL